MTKYGINLHCVALSTDMTNGKIFILSIDPTQLKFPTIELNKDNITDINKSLVDTMKRYLMTHELELNPQIISLNSTLLGSKNRKNTLNTVVGFLIKENVKNFDSHWIEFDFRTFKSDINPLIFEIIQRLQ